MPPPPLVAGRFLLERPAGSGGMGTVYRALDRHSGEAVALKLLASDAEPLRARALVEADALAALDHPAIVRLVAHGLADDGRPFLAMEWLEGEDLAARLARAPLTADEAVRLGARVAAALAAAHARGVLHRDLKPSNLFLPGDDVDHVKLVDFGIARLAHAGRRLTLTGAAIGTPGYMAPEQVSGDGNLGPAVDLFALGAVLFECLAGRPAFRGESPMALLAKVLLDEPPRLDALRTDLPPALADFVAGLLAKDPACRPAAAEAASALAALRSALEPALLSAGAPTPAAAGLSGAEQRLVCVLFARTLPDEGAKDGAGAAFETEDGRTEDGRTEDGRTEDGRTEDGRTEDGRTEDGGTADGGPEDGGPEDGAGTGENAAGPSAL
ncbi:MAG TPA: serine/threonine-protein kinase, partial [Polyangiaceae bacterium]|nr:serine/threonine-protein kinase [Polyangiaceae bacterium]